MTSLVHLSCIENASNCAKTTLFEKKYFYYRVRKLPPFVLAMVCMFVIVMLVKIRRKSLENQIYSTEAERGRVSRHLLSKECRYMA